MKEFSKDKLIKKDEWFIRGTGFSVKISHVFRKGFPNLGIEDNHAWCLYVMMCTMIPFTLLLMKLLNFVLDKMEGKND